MRPSRNGLDDRADDDAEKLQRERAPRRSPPNGDAFAATRVAARTVSTIASSRLRREGNGNSETERGDHARAMTTALPQAKARGLSALMIHCSFGGEAADRGLQRPDQPVQDDKDPRHDVRNGPRRSVRSRHLVSLQRQNIDKTIIRVSIFGKPNLFFDIHRRDSPGARACSARPRRNRPAAWSRIG